MTLRSDDRRRALTPELSPVAQQEPEPLIDECKEHLTQDGPLLIVPRENLAALIALAEAATASSRDGLRELVEKLPRAVVKGGMLSVQSTWVEQDRDLLVRLDDVLALLAPPAPLSPPPVDAPTESVGGRLRRAAERMRKAREAVAPLSPPQE